MEDGFKLIYKTSGIFDREYHGSQGGSRWFCEIYCAKAVIVGLIGGCLSFFSIYSYNDGHWGIVIGQG